MSSCGEVYDLNGFDWEPELPLSDSVFNREIQIVNYYDESTGQNFWDNSDSRYFSLERFSAINPNYKSTKRWDIAFSGMYITTNNGTAQGLGYGSSGLGGIAILDTPYSKLTEVPEDIVFTTPGSIGLDYQGTMSYVIGYAVYTYGGNFVRPDKVSNYDENDANAAAEANLYRHMIYGLSEDLLKAFPDAKNLQKTALRPRTMLLRTANGNYAKLEVQSIYKDTLDPLLMKRGIPIPYLSFRYMVIKEDEKRFGFVVRQPSLTIDLSRNVTTVGE